MWPERFGEKELARIEATIGPYMASGRLQQMPVPKGGGIIKRDWWQLWGPEEAAKYGLEWTDTRKEFPPTELVVGSLDTALGQKEENDFSAFTVWGVFVDRKGNRRAMLMYAWAHRLKLHGKLTSALPGEPEKVFKARQLREYGLVELIQDTCTRYKVQRLLIEDKTRGRDVAEEITRLYARENWGVELINPVRDKVSRTHAVVPLFTDNGVWAPNTVWAEKVITECSNFPKAEHDDLHDTAVMFMLWAREQGILLRGDEASYALEDELTYRPNTSRSVADAYGV
jgi:predicted phage terminase large subunit-like protein